MNKILLVGQPINKNKRGFVGSGGGYVRNMRVYLQYFQSKELLVIPCFHTSRKEYSHNIFAKILRVFIDTKRFLKSLISVRPDGIHIMAQYRDALPREVMFVLLSLIFNKPILYEIKAGAFISEFEKRSNLYKKLIRYILSNSKIIIVEGEKYVNFLKDKFQIKGYYFPNVVPNNEIPKIRKNILNRKTINVLFVGYCYYKKGVFHLIEACNKFSNDNYLIELHLIGREEERFKGFLDQRINLFNFRINRYGRQSHEFILEKMQECDIFCYPSFHPGEGHSNSINEALMNGMVIVTTKNGFLGDILDDNSAYFIREKNVQDIYNVLVDIDKDRTIAREKAVNGYQKVLNNYTVSNVKEKINFYYKDLINK